MGAYKLHTRINHRVRVIEKKKEREREREKERKFIPIKLNLQY